MKINTWMRSATVLLMLFSVSLAEEIGIDSSNGLEPVRNAMHHNAPGPKWPICWSFEFGQTKPLASGETQQVKVFITSALFDMTDVELRPMAGGVLKVVEGPLWKGSLKKGEVREVTFVVKSTANSPDSPYGVQVVAPNFYDELKKYIGLQTNGYYANPFIQQEIYDRIEAMRKSMPVCTEWAGGAILAKEPEGK